MYAIFYSKIVEQVNVVRKYAPIPTDNFSIKLARPHDMIKMAFPWQPKRNYLTAELSWRSKVYNTGTLNSSILNTFHFFETEFFGSPLNPPVFIDSVYLLPSLAQELKLKKSRSKCCVRKNDYKRT